MDLYTRNALKCAEITTRNYSTSFSLGVRTLNRRYRPGIYAIYGVVRFADEIVDTFHGHNKEELLADFKRQTYDAIENRMSLNPILHAYQWAVNAYAIDRELIGSFFQSMEMDLEKTSFSRDEYQKYIYGSAEVVGLMCLRIFYAGRDDRYRQLLPPARKLGEAFQKVNFLRDIRADHTERGRVYFPGLDIHNFSPDAKDQIEREIWDDFKAAIPGIRSLDKEVRLGVYLAYRYYLELLRKIEGADPLQVQQQRFRVSNATKLVLLMKCYLRNVVGWIR